MPPSHLPRDDAEGALQADEGICHLAALPRRFDDVLALVHALLMVRPAVRAARTLWVPRWQVHVVLVALEWIGVDRRRAHEDVDSGLAHIPMKAAVLQVRSQALPAVLRGFDALDLCAFKGCLRAVLRRALRDEPACHRHHGCSGG